jgi:hypothetical protein
MTDLTRAEADVIAERRRHVSGEGWTAQHDDRYENDELAYAAAAYAGPIWPDEAAKDRGDLPIGWPWEPRWYKPRTRRQDLVRAASLILADIERIDRAEAAAQDAQMRAGVGRVEDGDANLAGLVMDLEQAHTTLEEPEHPDEAPAQEEPHPFLNVSSFKNPDGIVDSLFMRSRISQDDGRTELRAVRAEAPGMSSLEAAEDYVFRSRNNQSAGNHARVMPGEERVYADPPNAIVINRHANLIALHSKQGAGNVVLLHETDLSMLTREQTGGFQLYEGPVRQSGRWTYRGAYSSGIAVWTASGDLPAAMFKGQAAVVLAPNDPLRRVATIAEDVRGHRVVLQKIEGKAVVDDYIKIVNLYEPYPSFRY